MIALTSATRVFVSLDPVDLRKSFGGLQGLVKDQLCQDPLSGHVFMFTNRNRNRLKLLYWDGYVTSGLRPQRHRAWSFRRTPQIPVHRTQVPASGFTATASQATFPKMARPDSASVACGPAAMPGLSEADAGDCLHRQPGCSRENSPLPQSLVRPSCLRSGSAASRF